MNWLRQLSQRAWLVVLLISFSRVALPGADWDQQLTITIDGQEYTARLVAERTPPEGSPAEASPTADTLSGTWSFSLQPAAGDEVLPNTIQGIEFQPVVITNTGDQAYLAEVGGEVFQPLNDLLVIHQQEFPPGSPMLFIPVLPSEFFHLTVIFNRRDDETYDIQSQEGDTLGTIFASESHFVVAGQLQNGHQFHFVSSQPSPTNPEDQAEGDLTTGQEYQAKALHDENGDPDTAQEHRNLEQKHQKQGNTQEEPAATDESPTSPMQTDLGKQTEGTGSTAKPGDIAGDTQEQQALVQEPGSQPNHQEAPAPADNSPTSPLPGTTPDDIPTQANEPGDGQADAGVDASYPPSTSDSSTDEGEGAPADTPSGTQLTLEIGGLDIGAEITGAPQAGAEQQAGAGADLTTGGTSKLEL